MGFTPCTLQHQAAQEDLEWNMQNLCHLHIEKTVSNNIQNYLQHLSFSFVSPGFDRQKIFAECVLIAWQ